MLFLLLLYCHLKLMLHLLDTLLLLLMHGHKNCLGRMFTVRLTTARFNELNN